MKSRTKTQEVQCTIPEEFLKIQKLRKNTYIEDERITIFQVWCNTKAKAFEASIPRRVYRKAKSKKIHILGSLMSGDMVGVADDGRIVVMVHDESPSVVLVSEMKCEEFTRRLLALDEGIEKDVFAQVIPTKPRE